MKLKTRYVFDGEVQTFLAAVAESSEARRDTIEKGSVLWRAQRGYVWRKENPGTEQEFEVPDAFEAERMVPQPEFVGDGRVNPRGIPCLYLSSTKEAAMAEVRPWRGSFISLAQFKIMRDIDVVNCTKDKKLFPNWLLHETPQALPTGKREEIAWGEIGYAFSRPITPDDPPTEYVPTQILAELFRAHKFDGIMYRSLLGKGINVALFDCASAELLNCGLYETSTIEFKFDQCSNPYFVRKHYEALQTSDREKREEEDPTQSDT